MRIAVLSLVFSLGCVQVPSGDRIGGGVGGPGAGGGADGDGCETVSCYLGDEVFCGSPTVRLGTGLTAFEPLQGDVMPIVWAPAANGGVCGYHLELAFETEHMCPVIVLDYQVHLLGIDGGAIADGNRTIQFVREQPSGSRQHIWSINAVLPEAYYPSDSEHVDVCPGGQELPCDESEFLIQVRVEDLSGRTAEAEYLLQPVCCEG